MAKFTIQGIKEAVKDVEQLNTALDKTTEKLKKVLELTEKIALASSSGVELLEVPAK